MLGNVITVYMESIGQIFTEYLVNFDYMVRVLENYGFVLPSPDEVASLHLPKASGSFLKAFTKSTTA